MPACPSGPPVGCLQSVQDEPGLGLAVGLAVVVPARDQILFYGGIASRNSRVRAAKVEPEQPRQIHSSSAQLNPEQVIQIRHVVTLIPWAVLTRPEAVQFPSWLALDRR